MGVSIERIGACERPEDWDFEDVSPCAPVGGRGVSFRRCCFESDIERSDVQQLSADWWVKIRMSLD